MSASPESRVEQALASAELSPALLQLATALRDAGTAQPELQALFESFAARHQEDTDQSRYDALLDTLDLIVGWCSPGQGAVSFCRWLMHNVRTARKHPGR